jgi:hypothetical protein
MTLVIFRPFILYVDYSQPTQYFYIKNIQHAQLTFLQHFGMLYILTPFY